MLKLNGLPENTITNEGVRNFCEERKEQLINFAYDNGIISDRDVRELWTVKKGVPEKLNFVLNETYSRIHGMHITRVLKKMGVGIVAFKNATVTDTLDGSWTTTATTVPVEIKIRHYKPPKPDMWIDENKVRAIIEDDGYLVYGWRHDDDPSVCTFGVFKPGDRFEVKEGEEVKRDVSQSYDGGTKETPVGCFYMKDAIWSGTTKTEYYQ